MNSRTTWSLAVLAGVLFACIFLSERQATDAPNRDLPSLRLFPELDPAKVSSLEIVRGTNVIRAERLDSEWRLTTPLYPADSSRIDNFIRALSLLPQRAYIPSAELPSQTNALASFGLDPAQASVTLFTGTNQLRFRVGAKTLLNEQNYVQKQGDEGVEITDAEPLNALPASVTEWRQPKLLHLDRLAFDRVSVTNGPTTFVLEFDSTNQLWNLTWPFPARADFAAVNYLIQQLRQTRISRFVTDDPKADADRYGLQAPEVEMALSQGTSPLFQLQFGTSPTNDPTQVFVRRLSHSNIVLAPKALVDLLRSPHESFRDKTLLPFAAAVVDRIEVKAKETFALEKGTNAAWRIVQPFAAPADAVMVKTFFESLARLEISKFTKDVVTDLAAFGLAQPARQYILRASVTNSVGVTNRIVAQVDFATNHVDEVYARRGDEGSVYTVSYGDTLALPQAAYELRNRRLWDFASSNVIRVLIQQHHRTNRLERSATRAWASDPVQSEAIEETLHRLGELTAISWRAKGEANLNLFGFAENPHQITLEVAEGGKTQNYTLKLGKRRNQDESYASTELEEKAPVIFLIPSSLHAMMTAHLSVPAVAPSP